MPSYESYAVDLDIPLDKLRGLNFCEKYDSPETVQINVKGFRLAWFFRLYPRGLKFRDTKKESRSSQFALEPVGLDLGQNKCSDLVVGLAVQWKVAGIKASWLSSSWIPAYPVLKYTAFGFSETESDFVSVLSSSHESLLVRIVVRLDPALVTPIMWLDRRRSKSLAGFPPESPRLKAQLDFAQREGGVEIRCEDGSLKSSQDILSSLSAYFRRLFVHKRDINNNNSDEENTVVDFKVYPKKVVELVVEHLITGRFYVKNVECLCLAEMKSLLDLKNQVGAEGAAAFDAIIEMELSKRHSNGAPVEVGLELEKPLPMLQMAHTYGLKVLKNLFLSHLLSLGPTAVLLNNDYAELPKRLQREVGEAFSAKTFQRQFASARLPDAEAAGYASD